MFSLIKCLGVPVSCGVPFGVSIATTNTNMPLTHLEDVEYRCEHVHAIDGDPKSITSFRVVRAVAGLSFVRRFPNTLPPQKFTHASTTFRLLRTISDVTRAKFSMMCSSSGILEMAPMVLAGICPIPFKIVPFITLCAIVFLERRGADRGTQKL